MGGKIVLINRLFVANVAIMIFMHAVGPSV